MPRKILLTAGPDGTLKLETKGFTGTDCKIASKGLEEALGMIESDVPTAEARITVTETTREKTTS